MTGCLDLIFSIGMRKTFSTILASFALLLTACVPPPEVNLEKTVPPPQLDQTTSSSAPHNASIELAIDETGASSSAMTSTGALAERMAEHGVLEIGPADAPSTLTVFTNFSCRYCQEFARDMLPALEKEFVATGRLKLRTMITPLKKYPNSGLEASALVCSTALGKGQGMWNALSDAKLRDRASILNLLKKLDISKKEFSKCLDAKETKATLDQQAEFVHTNDVTLIPTFILNGEKEIGLMSYADLHGWIRSVMQQ